MARKPPPPPSLDTARRQVVPAAPVVLGESRLTGAREVLHTQLVPDRNQPRRMFDMEAMTGLVQSLRQHGVIQALLVRRDGTTTDGQPRYVIIDGERRWRAAELAPVARLPVVVRDEDARKDVLILQLIANGQRQAFDPLEEALSFREAMDERNLPVRGLADLIGINYQQIQRQLNLLLLLDDERLAKAARDGRITGALATEIRTLPPTAREDVARRISTGEDIGRDELRRLKRAARQPTEPAPSAIPVTRRHSMDRAATRDEDTTAPAVVEVDTSGAVTPRHKDDGTVDLVRTLHDAFKDWRMRVFQAIPGLSKKEEVVLARLIRCDVEGLLGQLDRDNSGTYE